MYGQDILYGISKVPFEIPHKIHWKIWFLYNIEILRALRFKSSYTFLNPPWNRILIYIQISLIGDTLGHTELLPEQKQTQWGYGKDKVLLLFDVFHICQYRMEQCLTSLKYLPI